MGTYLAPPPPGNSCGATMGRLREVKYVHRAFEATLVLKAVFAAAETLAGLGAHFMTQALLFGLVERITRAELLEDRRDFVANYLVQSAQHFSVDARDFTAAYLVAHGIVKLWLIAGLLRRKLWYYPVAIATFGLFIVYQMYRYSLTRSPWLIVITVVDLAVIGLTWLEYRSVRAGLLAEN
jgi:uncharacterized membrane protein